MYKCIACIYMLSFIPIHPVVFLYITNKWNTPPNTTLECHITLCYVFHFARTVIRHVLLQKFKKVSTLNILIEQLYAKMFLCSSNCCKRKCLMMVRAKWNTYRSVMWHSIIVFFMIGLLINEFIYLCNYSMYNGI